MQYFSEKELGPKQPTEQVISVSVWGGIVSLIDSHISSGSFGNQFPKMCPDGAGVIGTDIDSFQLAAKAEVPNISWPLQTVTRNSEDFMSDEKPFAPDTLDILDLIEFCHNNVAKPIQIGYHEFFKHHHLTFDSEKGQQEFRKKINRIFSRNGIAYELNVHGNIIRLVPVILQESLLNAVFQTSDSTLNQMLEESRKKFLNPDSSIRREALERLWDSWERIKSLENPSDKKDSTKRLLDKVANEPNFRSLIEEEAQKLTNIGNEFHIRHTEIGKTAIVNDRHIDYLFHRLFSFIQLILNSMK